MTPARSLAEAAPPKRTARGGRNRVRIVGGTWRSRLVRFPPAAGLRPTPDRVRETLFNWLGQRLDGMEALDLFAGSGVLGFEALSRGAARAILVESDRRVAEALRASARELGARSAHVVEGDALGYLARTGERFDVVFVDPPYASGLAERAMRELAPHLKPGGRVYVESAGPIEPGEPWRALRAGRAGAVRYALFGIPAP
ncbi:MAG TPA: 16S rRNA (guanine(966)-N(2))-methyltransferase RsmD [Usitatibacter sp.]|nr:16S rRNA (guanine(966)-N(2))-methyltransferase RsmD [Usitatibacter sp.]